MCLQEQNWKSLCLTDSLLCWGAGSRVLPFVVLKGSGVVVGRGREVFEARLRALETVSPALNMGGVWPAGMNKRYNGSTADWQ